MRVGLIAGCLVAGLIASAQAFAATRDTTLILSFRMLCTSEPPNFEHIDQAATAARFQLLRRIDRPLNDGMFMRQKMWLVVQESGQHALMAIEGNGPDGYLTGCGIVSNDLNAEGFKAALIEAFKLGRPTLEKAMPAPGVTMRMTRWDGVFGPGTALQLAQGPQGAGLDYQVREPRRH